MDLKDFSGLWVCFGLDADSATMNANGRSEPKPTDVAESTNVSDAQKADFAKSRRTSLIGASDIDFGSALLM